MGFFDKMFNKKKQKEEEEKQLLNAQKMGWEKPTDAEMVAEINLLLHPDYNYYFENNYGGDGMVWMKPKDGSDVGSGVHLTGFSRQKDPNIFYFIEKDGNLYKSKSEKYRKLDIVALELKRLEDLKVKIKNVLIEKSVKIPISDIDAHLKHQNRDEIKQLCQEMYNNGEISFAGNGRYFVLTEEKEIPKKSSAPKSKEVDVEKELEKLKGLLDKGLITQEAYDAKMNQLLDL